MASLDLFARSSTITLLATMVLVLARDFRRVPSAPTGIAFFVTIAAHLVLTSPDYAGVRALDVILYPAALAVPGTFWLFSRDLFDEENGLTWQDAAMFATLLATGFLRSTPDAGVGTVLYYASSLALVAVALARVIRGFPADLVEPRRRLRAVLTVAVGLEILMVIGGEILLGGARPPRWVDTLKGSGAFALTLLFTVWSLTPRRQLFAAERVAGSVIGTVTAVAEASGEDAPAEAIPLPDQSMDTVVSTWTLCSIPDVTRALSEIRRVLKGDGRLLFAEHGRSPEPRVVQWQDRLTPLWKRIGGGCHLNRPIDQLVRASGFRVEHLRTGYMAGPRPMTFTYEGVARRS